MRVTRWCAAVVALAMSGAALAETYVTTGRGFACGNKRWMEDVLAIARNNDSDSLRAYHEKKRCFVPKEDLVATIISRHDDDADLPHVVVIIMGVRLWVSPETVAAQSSPPPAAPTKAPAAAGGSEGYQAYIPPEPYFITPPAAGMPGYRSPGGSEAFAIAATDSVELKQTYEDGWRQVLVRDASGTYRGLVYLPPQ